MQVNRSSLRTLSRRHRPAAIIVALAMATATMPVSAETVGTGTFGCTTPPEDILHLDVSNPGPGDQMPAGDTVIHGVAYDRSAQTDNSVDRVSLFLGTRNAGGSFLTDATLGMPNPDAQPGQAHQMAGWNATVALPNSPGPQTLVVYAHSGVTDHESSVAIPFMLGQSSAAGAQCSTSTTAGTSATSQADTIHLELSNSKPQDSVKVGALAVQGVAFDAAAETGPGVDRVTFFLDSRDQGGFFLTDTVPGQSATESGVPAGFYQATLDMPNQVGGHTLFVYAHSSVTGHDAVISVPITVVR
jgi:hypothetical protein